MSTPNPLTRELLAAAEGRPPADPLRRLVTDALRGRTHEDDPQTSAGTPPALNSPTLEDQLRAGLTTTQED